MLTTAEKKNRKIIVDLFTEVYANATPKVDYSTIDPETFDYSQYTIEESLCNQIIDKHLDKIKPKKFRQSFYNYVYLAHLPIFN